MEGGGWGLGGKLEKAQRSRTTEGLIRGNGREGRTQTFRELKAKCTAAVLFTCCTSWGPRTQRATALSLIPDEMATVFCPDSAGFGAVLPPQRPQRQLCPREGSRSPSRRCPHPARTPGAPNLARGEAGPETSAELAPQLRRPGASRALAPSAPGGATPAGRAPRANAPGPKVRLAGATAPLQHPRGPSGSPRPSAPPAPVCDSWVLPRPIATRPSSAPAHLHPLPHPATIPSSTIPSFTIPASTYPPSTSSFSRPRPCAHPSAPLAHLRGLPSPAHPVVAHARGSLRSGWSRPRPPPAASPLPACDTFRLFLSVRLRLPNASWLGAG